ncbi:hypothetical protein T492DRAFT_880459, partial [Pavlovales sp. CCMP2436]
MVQLTERAKAARQDLERTQADFKCAQVKLASARDAATAAETAAAAAEASEAAAAQAAQVARQQRERERAAATAAETAAAAAEASEVAAAEAAQAARQEREHAQVQLASARAAEAAAEAAKAVAARAAQELRDEIQRAQEQLASTQGQLASERDAAAKAAEAAAAAADAADQAELASALAQLASDERLQQEEEAGTSAAGVVRQLRKRPHEDVLPPAQDKAARPEAAPSEAKLAAPLKSKLKRMRWEQLSAHLRDNAARAGARHLALTLGVVAARAYEVGGKQAAVAAGVLPALLAAMRTPSTTAAVLKQACGALANITYSTDAQGDACIQAAVDAGALPQIVAAMRAPSATAAVQEQACGA